MDIQNATRQITRLKANLKSAQDNLKRQIDIYNDMSANMEMLKAKNPKASLTEESKARSAQADKLQALEKEIAGIVSDIGGYGDAKSFLKKLYRRATLAIQ